MGGQTQTHINRRIERRHKCRRQRKAHTEAVTSDGHVVGYRTKLRLKEQIEATAERSKLITTLRQGKFTGIPGALNVATTKQLDYHRRKNTGRLRLLRQRLCSQSVSRPTHRSRSQTVSMHPVCTQMGLFRQIDRPSQSNIISKHKTGRCVCCGVET